MFEIDYKFQYCAFIKSELGTCKGIPCTRLPFDEEPYPIKTFSYQKKKKSSNNFNSYGLCQSAKNKDVEFIYSINKNKVVSVKIEESFQMYFVCRRVASVLFTLTIILPIKLMVRVQKAPVLHHFSETIAGAATIRCFDQEEHFFTRNLNLIDDFSCIVFCRCHNGIALPLCSD